MPHKLKFGRIAAISLLGVLFGEAPPAVAGDCGSFGCRTEVVVQPQPYPYEHYHYLSHGPDHDYSPMYFYDGHGGHIEGQWYRGGLAWRYVRPQYYGQSGAGRW